MSELNIYQRLLKITEKLKTVGKNLTVGSGSYEYKAVGEMDILNAVKPLEIKYGVYSYPMSRKVVTSEVITTKKNDKESTKFFLRVETVYRFVNIEKPDEFVDQVSYGDGVDSLDKSPGKAMTYSDKYSLMKAYKIMTGDDPDQNHSNDTTVKGNQPKDQARLTEQQKDTLIQQIQEGKNELQPILEYYNIKSLDELSFNQAKSVIVEGNK